MKPEDNFKRIVAVYGPRLLSLEFGLSPADVAAIFGSFGHESLGMTKLQEIKPTVPGSRGGYGWAQWTGPRRRDYEAFCRENNYKPESDEANFKFFLHELRGSEKQALTALRKAPTLQLKVEAFELAYERAGVKHYPSRLKWAELALETLENLPAVPVDEPEKETEMEKNSMTAVFIGLLVRHALMAVAGALGLSAADTGSFVTGGVAAIMALLSVAWSAYQKLRNKPK